MNAPGSSNTTTTVVIAGRDETGPASKSATANLRGVGSAGTQATRDLAQAGAAYVESLQRQVEAIGKTRSEIAQLRAQQLGVTQAAAPYIAQLRSQEQAINKVGISTAQTAAAMRTLPAQFTDIATQLAGGQSPFLVLLQQGGQVKDSFGGLGPAARALASLITPLRLAIAGTAGAVAALGLAWLQGSKESEGFNKSIALTGGYAGQSTSQLIDMAKAIGGMKGDTSLAAEALEQLVGSGRIAGGQLQEVAAAAVAFSRATGTAIDDVVKDFVKLADEPTKASAKLNEQYHYLTASVYEQIAALEEQGRKNEAAALAETTFANAMKERAASVASSLGVLQRAWNALAADARKAWDAMLDIGRPQSTGEKIASLQKQLDQRLAQGPLNEGTRGAFDKGVQALRDQLSILQSTNVEERKFAAQRSEYLQTQEASIKAQDRIRKQIEETASKQEKMNKAVADAKRDFDAIRKADPNSPLLKEEAKTLENIREKYKDRTPKPKAFQDDAATKMLERLREQNAAMEAQFDLGEKLTTADQERAKFNQLIADLKGKAQLTAEQKSLLANQEAIRAQLDINVATEKTLELKKKQAEQEKKAAEAMKQAKQLVEAINIRIDASLQGQRDQYDRQLSVIGLGSQAAEEVQSVKAIYREFEAMQTSFTQSMAKQGVLGSKEFEEGIARIRDGLTEALDLQRKYYQQVREEQADWVNGARQATQNYLDDVRNVAKSTEQAFSGAFKGIEDQLTNAFSGGKFDAGALGRQFAGEIIRPFVRQNITGPLAQSVQNFLPAKDELGDFIKKLDQAGAAKETAALATSASLATQSVKDLAVAAAAAARSLGGSGGAGDLKSIGTLLGTNTGALTTLANALPGDSLDNLFTLTNNFASFDVGTEFVEKDMFARLHKGERVVRAADNVGSQAAGGGDSYYFNVGDVASVSMVQKAIAAAQREAAGVLHRRRGYGGE